MKKTNIKFWILLPIFLIAELCLYYHILFQVSGRALSICCFSSILLACVFALCFCKMTTGILLNLGLIATVCADYFLILPDPLTYQNQVSGVAFFSIVQICYFCFLLCERKSRTQNIIHLLFRIIVVLVAEIALCIVLKGKADLLSVLSLFYISNLATNLLFAFAQGKKGILLSVGLLLFLCCDLFVGFSSAIGTYLPIGESSWLYKLVFADFNFIWFFYLPSQTIIALSLAKYNGYFRRK